MTCEVLIGRFLKNSKIESRLVSKSAQGKHEKKKKRELVNKNNSSKASVPDYSMVRLGFQEAAKSVVRSFLFSGSVIALAFFGVPSAIPTVSATICYGARTGHDNSLTYS